jgi:6-phosphogluconolactonase
MNASGAEWQVLDSAEQVAREASQRIARLARQAINEHGQFHFVLAGGKTPARVYDLLAEGDCDWHQWQLWFGDERCLPLDDPARNSRMVAEHLTERVPIPSSQVHVIPAERGARAAASAYSEDLPGDLCFDLVLLGMGEDGHTASLFPGFDARQEADVLAVFDAPKPPPERVSLSLPRLVHSRYVMLLVTGAAKADAVARWQRGEVLPVSQLAARCKLQVLADKAACRR